MDVSMADQATSSADRPSIGPDPETLPAGAPASPGFRERGRMRRRLRFLHKARELAYRDLGGLVFEMQRLGERHDELAAGKLATLAAIDTELRVLEGALLARQPLAVLRESGIAACPRCAAIHGSDDGFCPACGLQMGRRAAQPIAATPTQPPPAPPPVTFAQPAPPPPPAPSRPPATQPSVATPQPPLATQQHQVAAPPPPDAAPPPRAPDAPAADDRPTEIIRPPQRTPGEEA
jgi:hypothetical protein